MQKDINLNLSELSNGAIQEKIDRELKKVMQNILDPNTDFNKARKVSITISMSANEQRNSITTDVAVKSTLAPQKSVSTTVLVGRNEQTGQIQAAELLSNAPGQTFIDVEDGVLKTDTGTPIDDIEAGDDGIIDFNKRKATK
ncbi:hypothetical protein JHE06_05275 [Carnobacterium sp. CS13]|uniref:hypothetical protein n=1 Tax=Carnobacterium sp. CS13 TaxID=2800128 RepID=UPI001914174D|nr:hypothetical protein [Carnobacterium sp. CS13]QQP71182.1 hypothetical protein JHE06_05275 [Carnobacterium sp. CS13]